MGEYLGALIKILAGVMVTLAVLIVVDIFTGATYTIKLLIWLFML